MDTLQLASAGDLQPQERRPLHEDLPNSLNAGISLTEHTDKITQHSALLGSTGAIRSARLLARPCQFRTPTASSGRVAGSRAGGSDEP